MWDTSSKPAPRRWTRSGSLAAGFAVVILLAADVGSAPAQTPAPRRGGTMKMTYLEPVTLNSMVVSGTTAGIYGAQLYAGLVQLDDQFVAQPYLAERWEVSPDALRYTFHLVKGATFHDGKPITSEDVKFSIETSKTVHPFGLAIFRYLDTVDTPDPSTAVVRLSKPSPALLRTLVPLLVPILPRHVYAEGDIRKNPANRKPIGSGPFKFTDWQQGRFLILDRYENFFRKGRPYLDRLVYEFIPDPSTRVAGLETGDLHLVPFSYVPFVDARRVEKLPTIGLTTIGAKGYGSINLIELNLRNPHLKELKVRQAIAHALDREYIGKELLLGFGRPATGPLIAANPFYSAQVRRYEYSLDKANRLLDEAGFKRGPDGVRFKLNHELLAAFPDIIKTVAEYSREQLKKVGIDVVMRTSPDFPTYVSRVSNWEFDITTDFLSNYPDPVIGLDRTFLSSNIKKGVAYSNVMGYSNAEVDKLLAEAQTEQNVEKRKKLYARVQELLVEDLPIIWINELQFVTLYNKDYQGLPTGVLGVLDPFDTIFWSKAK
jgi:peptide/nickel transport system substrate-binding protein